MSAHLLNIASELRNGIYELLLLHEEVINPWSNYDQQLNAGLLLTNKVIHREASSLLYGQNRFDFSERTSESIASFLRQIGTNNASFIRDVHIDFPDFDLPDFDLPNFDSPDTGDITIDKDDVEIIRQIRDRCPNVSTLVMSLHSTIVLESPLDASGDAHIVTEALELVNNHLKAITSLKQIIVEVYENGLNDRIRREMERLGWTTREIENVEPEDFDRSFSDLDDYNSDYDNNPWEDSYDIDNDSDFWRRAAD